MAHAIVFRQNQPTPTGIKSGDVDIYAASITQLGHVHGTYAECWAQAKQATRHPLLHWIEGGPKNELL